MEKEEYNLNVIYFCYSWLQLWTLFKVNLCPAENQGFYFYKRHWCWQLTVSPISPMHIRPEAVFPLGHPTCVPHTIHTHPRPNLSHIQVHHESKTPSTDAGDSGAGERMGRKYLDGICETNWDREINTPICLRKITGLGTEHLKTSGKSLFALSQKGCLRFNFRKGKVIPFLNSLVLWTP